MNGTLCLLLAVDTQLRLTVNNLSVENGHQRNNNFSLVCVCVGVRVRLCVYVCHTLVPFCPLSPCGPTSPSYPLRTKKSSR